MVFWLLMLIAGWGICGVMAAILVYRFAYRTMPRVAERIALPMAIAQIPLGPYALLLVLWERLKYEHHVWVQARATLPVSQRTGLAATLGRLKRRLSARRKPV